MPNHCFNRVRITGTPDDITAVAALLITPDGTITFTKVVPQPEGLTDGDGWYDWRVTRWGTKWDAYDCEVTDRDVDTLAFECSTAWAPPEPIVQALRDRFPNLAISWFFDEPGMALAGYL